MNQRLRKSLPLQDPIYFRVFNRKRWVRTFWNKSYQGRRSSNISQLLKQIEFTNVSLYRLLASEKMLQASYKQRLLEKAKLQKQKTVQQSVLGEQTSDCHQSSNNLRQFEMFTLYCLLSLGGFAKYNVKQQVIMYF